MKRFSSIFLCCRNTAVRRGVAIKHGATADGGAVLNYRPPAKLAAIAEEETAWRPIMSSSSGAHRLRANVRLSGKIIHQPCLARW